MHEKSRSHYNCGFFCGAAGGRTPVRTRDHRAFYMLSFLLIFVNNLRENALIVSYPLKFHFCAKARKNYSVINSTSLPIEPQTKHREMSRSPNLCRGIKQVY